MLKNAAVKAVPRERKNKARTRIGRYFRRKMVTLEEEDKRRRGDMKILQEQLFATRKESCQEALRLPTLLCATRNER